jgi:uncharacterized protein (TIGR00730 family)
VARAWTGRAGRPQLLIVARHIKAFTLLRIGTALARKAACGGGESTPHTMLEESMSKINALCVYCGSSPGTDPAFVAAARDFGKMLGTNGIRLVYGGGSTGLMGALAEAVLDNGGDVTGIIPEFLTKKERPRRLAQELIVTRDMHERKQTMFERADGFVALPGGIGTLEELVEQLTWAQLGRHKKPILLANINCYWDPLLSLIAHMRMQEFLPAVPRVDCLIADHVEDILPKLIEACRDVSEADKAMVVPAERM